MLVINPSDLREFKPSCKMQYYVVPKALPYGATATLIPFNLKFVILWLSTGAASPLLYLI